MGPFGSNIKVETFVDAGVPVISGAHLRGVRLEDGDFNFVTDEHAERMKNSNVYRGDVIFTHAGNIGQVAYIPPNSQYERYVISQRQFYLRCDLNKADPAFISYFFHSNEGQHKLLANASQTGVPSIARPSSYLKTIELSLPPLTEQRAIAHILGTLDDKIELNRKQNETLEAMARALFKAWFVDFEPVRAKMEGRWQRGQSLPGLPAHLYDLFPDRLDDEGKPEGWEMRSVGDCFRLTMGQSPPGDTYNDTGDGLPFFQGRTDFGFRYPENRKYCSAPTRIADAEDTLVSVRAPVGDINLAWEKCCVGRGVAAVRHLSGARSFTYHAVWSIQEELRQYEHTGTVFGAINKKQFEAIGIIEPNPDLIESFEKMASPMDDEVRNNIEESRTLADLRDTLLPKLISGELRIADAEDFLKGRG